MSLKKITATRYHDFSYGHRVFGHENKCKHIHGHNGRIHFTLEGEAEAPLDSVGRVLDFSAIKQVLCEWLEKYWDHKMLIWMEDPWLDDLTVLDPGGVIVTDFNPTAENMASYLLRIANDELLPRSIWPYVRLIKVTVEETRKCSATAEIKS